MTFSGKWMQPEVITLSERSQTQKDKYYVFSPIGNLGFKVMYVQAMCGVCGGVLL